MTETTFLYKNLAANAATQVKTGTGKLHTITVNKAGASANTVTLYDGTDSGGTLIATIDGTAASGRTLIFDCRFVIGLHVVIATGTAADITINYL